MYDIYIKNYKNSSGVIVTTEQLLYSIPVTSTYQDNVVIDPVVKCEMGKTGTLEFGIRQNNPYYSCWQQMRTIARVVYDGTTIFRGRVLTIDNALDGSKKIHFEGDMAFLLDTHQPGIKEENRTEISILTYLQQLINKHNSEMDDNSQADKNDHKFSLGNVPGQYASSITTEMRVKTDATKKFGSDSRTTTMSALEELQKDYGGYFRTRYVNGTVYLDWLESWFNPTLNLQEIEISDNLIDLNENSEVDNIFTAVVPVGNDKGNEITIEGYKEDVHGHNDRILVPHIVSQFTDAELNAGYHTKSDYQNAINKYGIIYKVQKFENADTKEKLWNYCIDWIKNNYVGSIINYTLTAIDMHHLDGYVQKYLIGDRIKLVYPDPDKMVSDPGATLEKNVTITSITYNLHNPEKNSYSVGTPNNLIQKKYGSASGNKGSSGGGAHTQTDAEREREEYEAAFRASEEQAWTYTINGAQNSDIYESIINTYGPAAGTAAQRATFTIWMKTALKQEDPDIEQPETGMYQMIPSIIAGAENGTITLLKGLPDDAGKAKAQEMIDNRNLRMEFAESVILDGYNSGIFIKEPMDTETFPLSEEGYNRYCAQVDVYGKPNILEFGTTAFADNPAGRIVGGFVKAYHTVTDPIMDWLSGKKRTNTATVNGEDGSLDSIFAAFGIDGTGAIETVSAIVNGPDGSLALFNPDDITDEKDPTVTIAGEDASATFENTSGDPITVNKTITYTGSDGQTHTIEGAIKATDFYDTTIGSLNANLINVNDLVVNHTALIANLQAGVADIRELFSEYAKITNLSSHISNIDVISGKSAVFSGNVNVSGRLIAGTLFLGGTESAQNVSSAIKSITRTSAESATTTTLEILHFNGTKEELTFKRAAVPNMTGSWSSGTVQIKNANDPNSSVYYQATVSQGSISQDPDNPNYYSGNIVYSTTGQNTYNTGATYFIDATSRYNAGRNSVRTMKPTQLGFGQQGTSLGTLSGVAPGRVVHMKVGDTFYYFLCT